MKIPQDIYRLMDRDTKVLIKELGNWIDRREKMNLRREKEGTLLGPTDPPQPGKFKKMDNSILIAAVEKISLLTAQATPSSEKEPSL